MGGVPGDLVPQAPGGDSPDVEEDALVGVVVPGEFGVVPLDNEPGGTFDGLGTDFAHGGGEKSRVGKKVKNVKKGAKIEEENIMENKRVENRKCEKQKIERKCYPVSYTSRTFIEVEHTLSMMQESSNMLE